MMPSATLAQPAPGPHRTEGHCCETEHQRTRSETTTERQLRGSSWDSRSANLHRGCRRASAGYPLTYVEDPWLHITIAQITDAVGRSTPADERQQLASELQNALESVDPFTVTIGSCLSYGSGLIFDAWPDDQMEVHCEGVTAYRSCIKTHEAAPDADRFGP